MSQVLTVTMSCFLNVPWAWLNPKAMPDLFYILWLIFFPVLLQSRDPLHWTELCPRLSRKGNGGGGAAASHLLIYHQKLNEHWKTFKWEWIFTHCSPFLSHLHLCSVSALPLTFFSFYHLRLRPSKVCSAWNIQWSPCIGCLLGTEKAA